MAIGFTYFKNASVTEISDITGSDGSFIVHNGTGWVGESGATARASLSLGNTDTPTFANINTTISQGITGLTVSDHPTFDYVTLSTSQGVTGLATSDHPTFDYITLSTSQGVTGLATSDHPTFDYITLSTSQGITGLATSDTPTFNNINVSISQGITGLTTSDSPTFNSLTLTSTANIRNLNPDGDNTYDIGESDRRWKHLYGVGATLSSLTLTNAVTEFSTDGTLGDNSDSAIPTEKAVKTYADAAAAAAADEKVGIDSGATAGYLGAASSDGVLRTGTGITYTDGGDYATLSPDLVGDGTAGRVLRFSQLIIYDGTDADTVKPTVTITNGWNGDTFAQTDNIGKGETDGNMTLSATGKQLHLESGGLSGNVLVAMGQLYRNPTGNVLYAKIFEETNEISIQVWNENAVQQDLTALVDLGEPLSFDIFYITDA